MDVRGKGIPKTRSFRGEGLVIKAVVFGRRSSEEARRGGFKSTRTMAEQEKIRQTGEDRLLRAL